MTAALRSLAIALCAALLAGAANSADATLDTLELWKAEPGRVFDAKDVDLGALVWAARPVVVFADTPQDPAFRRQLDLLEARIDELIERDVIVIVDTSGSAPTEIRKKFRPRGFMLTLIGKDGEVELRKPFPWDVREISRSIDKMPLRQQEIRDGLANTEE